VDLQALTARAYGMAAADLRHVLSRFPLVPIELRERVVRHFTEIS
jgi:hypothetical protein